MVENSLADLPRCRWAASSNPLVTRYHDEEWGVALHEERALFEVLTLEAFVAGLSWSTILAKRENFRGAFGGFEIAKVARFSERSVLRLLGDAGIVRHRGKIEATLANARAIVALRAEDSPFDRFVWSFAPPPRRRPPAAGGVPARTERSDALSRELRNRGFRFVGSTTVYAFMQAAGLVDDHTVGCFRAARPEAAS
ncbi:MAG: DNA-3-methyladenine glycosylase I [Candidatus Baltobacteraceae bacterium]